ncbi:hypothetical protein CCMA1212_000200 [Trichoderma ghanense]|uniref:Transmembrane protein n=1 Tax=Trichoderma ghanense TaxID=65468 RepID=A0ABY2HH29_9HYPO
MRLRFHHGQNPRAVSGNSWRRLLHLNRIFTRRLPGVHPCSPFFFFLLLLLLLLLLSLCPVWHRFPTSLAQLVHRQKQKGRGDKRRKPPQHKGSTVTPQHGNTRSMQAASGNKITSAMEARGCRRKGWQEKAGDGGTRQNRLTYERASMYKSRHRNVVAPRKSRSNGKREKLGG